MPTKALRAGVGARIAVLVLLLCTVACHRDASTAAGPMDGTTPPAAGATLLQPTDLRYVGSFRVPHTSPDTIIVSGTIVSSFAYGGTGLGFDPDRNGLFMVGHDWGQVMAEISIPTPVASSDVAQLPFATYLQPFAEPTAGLRNFTSEPKIGGAMVDNGRLVLTVYEYYDASASVTVSHLWRSTTLSDPAAHGMYTLAGVKAGVVAGYMDHVPLAWRDSLGATAITGQNGIAIISRSSLGPAAVGFDPSDLGASVSTPVAAHDYLDYPAAANTQLPGAWWTDHAAGVAFVDRHGKRGVVFVGHIGAGTTWYGFPTGPNGETDPCADSKGTHAQGRSAKLWLYDPNDFVAVKRGTKQPYELRPYATFIFTSGLLGQQCTWIGGAAYDAATGRLYISQLYADQVGYSPYPVVHVFEVP